MRVGVVICVVGGVVGALGAAGAARADGVAEEVSAGSVPASEAAPGSRWLADKIAGQWDANERWQLRADLSATQVFSDASDTARGAVWLATLAASYAADEHWTVRLTAGGSPSATTRARAPIGGVLGDARPAEAELTATSASLTAGAGLDYDTASDGVHALSASLSIAATYTSAQQAITGAIDASGDRLDGDALRMRCRVACSALDPQWVQLGQFALAASVTDTVDRDTDLSLDASYFVYDHDPMQLGYFALATTGLNTLGSAAGVAPLRDAVTPSASHRWGALSASASVTYTAYVDAQGTDFTAGARVQYKLALAGTHRLRLYGKLGVGMHVDPMTAPSRSASAGLGAQYTW